MQLSVAIQDVKLLRYISKFQRRGESVGVTVQVHVDRFLASVKKALRQLRREIHAIERTVHPEAEEGSERAGE